MQPQAKECGHEEIVQSLEAPKVDKCSIKTELDGQVQHFHLGKRHGANYKGPDGVEGRVEEEKEQLHWWGAEESPFPVSWQVRVQALGGQETMMIHVVLLERCRHGYGYREVCPDAKQPVCNWVGISKDDIVRDVMDANKKAVVDETGETICCHCGPEVGQLGNLSDIVDRSDINHHQDRYGVYKKGFWPHQFLDLRMLIWS